MPLTYHAAARTDIGRVRRSNQDAFGSDAELGLFVVCDGMGGAAGGDLASRIAVDTFLDTARQELRTLPGQGSQAASDALTRAVAAANRAVVDRACWDTRFRGMGSTLVAARITGDQLTVIHVGDSRAYLVRNGSATQLTEDHSVVAERVRRGLMTLEQAETSSMGSIITRAIGADPDVRPDLHDLTLQPGDTILLASDGLTRPVGGDELAAILSAGAEISADELSRQLIDLANHRGGPDNITCLILRIGDRP